MHAGREYDGYTQLDNPEDFDYLIGGCHYIKTWDGYHSVDYAKDEQWQAIETHFDSDPMACVETYIDRTRARRPDILAYHQPRQSPMIKLPPEPIGRQFFMTYERVGVLSRTSWRT